MSSNLKTKKGIKDFFKNRDLKSSEKVVSFIHDSKILIDDKREIMERMAKVTKEKKLKTVNPKILDEFKDSFNDPERIKDKKDDDEKKKLEEEVKDIVSLSPSKKLTTKREIRKLLVSQKIQISASFLDKLMKKLKAIDCSERRLEVMNAIMSTTKSFKRARLTDAQAKLLDLL